MRLTLPDLVWKSAAMPIRIGQIERLYSEPLPNWPTMIDALCPPKPKLLLIAIFRFRCAGLIGSVVKITIGIRRLQIDGGRHDAVLAVL